MKKFLTKTTALTAGVIYSVFGFFTESLADIDPGLGKIVDLKPSGADKSLPAMIQTFLVWILGFLALIALIIFIVAGLMIMTAGGDDDKVKKGKTWMINAVIGIVVIFLSYSIVKWIFIFFKTGAPDQGAAG